MNSPDWIRFTNFLGTGGNPAPTLSGRAIYLRQGLPLEFRQRVQLCLRCAHAAVQWVVKLSQLLQDIKTLYHCMLPCVLIRYAFV